MRIVIIEDEIRIREGLSRLLKKLDTKYEIAGEAENGEEGLALIRRVMPELIITDIRMPVMDGLEMLTKLQEEGFRAKVIVLSAYSEFEYARQAMRMGVKEYLLKPVVLGDITEALHRIEEEMRQEKELSRDVFGSAEQIFGGILSGTLDADEAMEERLQEHFGIRCGTRYQGICVYLGKSYEKTGGAARKELEQLLAQRKGTGYFCVGLDRDAALVILIYRDDSAGELERWVQYWLLQSRSRKLRGAVGFICDLALGELKGGIATLMAHMEWNISLGDDVMICYPKITKLQTSPCIYPLLMENQMRLAVCAGQKEKVKDSMLAFYGYFSGGKVYSPREIKECYVRFFWALMNTGKEVGMLEYEKLEQQKLLEQIMGAKTAGELEAVGEFLLDQLADDGEEVMHLTVKRAQSLIQEFYQNGITLEEIAAKLNITPEYLGTRFHQEVGVNFSAYIRNFRITKAKELLIGTSLKLYEIAEKVGYSDAKYFSRVFKETTGQLPADYRKTHK